ncbi:ribosomal protein S7 [Rhizodiscina lignyota]|uniref:Small ribosomal subunit protein uS7m n=1 Tax=Rhizodiscina lignyota TaxID=1504668 RepID=A0A9P4MB15_9PEZI|nr:ribosomal protein S7 [Rhizodiscina lignyota]
MPPRIPVFSVSKSLPHRSRVAIERWRGDAQLPVLPRCRAFADSSKDLPKSKDGKGPNMDQLPHASEEAAATAKITGEEGPDLQQGTPVEEVVKGDKEAEKNLPKVMQEALKSKTPNSKRSFSTMAGRMITASARTHQDLTQNPTDPAAWDAVLANLNAGDSSAVAENTGAERSTWLEERGYQFDPVWRSQNFKQGVQEALPAGVTGLQKSMSPDTTKVTDVLPNGWKFKERYDPLVAQFVGLMIRDGKKATAERHMTLILTHLRTSPPPKVSPLRPLLPGAPPPSHLPLNPLLYLQLAIDSVAPLLRMKSIRGAAGGGQALQLPVPLQDRQRRRTAIKWILDAASKRRNHGSGKGAFAQRVAEELIAVVEGKSGVWDKRNGIHKMGVAARANMNQRIRTKKSF